MNLPHCTRYTYKLLFLTHQSWLNFQQFEKVSLEPKSSLCFLEYKKGGQFLQMLNIEKNSAKISPKKHSYLRALSQLNGQVLFNFIYVFTESTIAFYVLTISIVEILIEVLWFIPWKIPIQISTWWSDVEGKVILQNITEFLKWI